MTATSSSWRVSPLSRSTYWLRDVNKMRLLIVLMRLSALAQHVRYLFIPNSPFPFAKGGRGLVKYDADGKKTFWTF